MDVARLGRGMTGNDRNVTVACFLLIHSVGGLETSFKRFDGCPRGVCGGLRRRRGGSCLDDECAVEECDELSASCVCPSPTQTDAAPECFPVEDLCDMAAERVGHGVCSHTIADDSAWNASSIPFASRGDVKRLSKYLIPVEPNSPLPPTFSDTNFYRLHFCMLQEAFEPIFPGYRYADYNWDVYFRERRRMFAGSIYEFSGEDVAAPFAFLIETPQDPDELLTEEEVYTVYRRLQDRFGAGELAYLPYSAGQIERAATWTDAPFEVVVAGDELVTFEPYSTGATYGRVRLFAAEEVDDIAGSFGAQDLLILEAATNALEGANAGVITSTRQDVLSHLNVLAGQRGTPNAFVEDALEAFGPFEGELVRLDVLDGTYTVSPATIDEAESFWANNRPQAQIDRQPDTRFDQLLTLQEMQTGSGEERGRTISRFGGKATGLATLSTHLDPQFQVAGFGIPVSRYFEFLSANEWELEVDGETMALSYAETLALWLEDDAFRTDTQLRRERLDALTEHMEDESTIDATLVASLEEKVSEVFGDASVMVRFRSSSNAEDGVDFNGAGLYESTRVCVLDDPDREDPSVCDSESKARPIARALRKVWASAWGFGAFEERQYFQIDQTRVAMGILVSTRFADEQADGVVFSGNPLDPSDTRVTVNVQFGEEDVVSSTPGVTAELNRLTISDGEVTDIERVSASTLAQDQQRVLSDAQLRELGGVVAAVQDQHPLPAGADSSKVLWDMEFKIDAAGDLKIKQIRPFVARAADPNYASCELE